MNKMKTKLTLITCILILSGCASLNESIKNYQANKRQDEIKQIQHLMTNSFEFNKDGFDKAIAKAPTVPLEDPYLPKIKSTVIKKNTKGQGKYLFKHAVSNLESDTYFKIPFTFNLEQYDPKTQAFYINLSSSAIEKYNNSSIKSQDGKYHLNLVPEGLLYRKDGYIDPYYYTYNANALKVVYDTRRCASKSKSVCPIRQMAESAASRNIIPFNVQGKRDAKTWSSRTIGYKATPTTARQLVNSKKTFYAFVKPVIIFKIDNLNEYVLIYNPNDEFKLTDGNKLIFDR